MTNAAIFQKHFDAAKYIDLTKMPIQKIIAKIVKYLYYHILKLCTIGLNHDQTINHLLSRVGVLFEEYWEIIYIPVSHKCILDNHMFKGLIITIIIGFY